jgi:hypothetical protein
MSPPPAQPRGDILQNTSGAYRIGYATSPLSQAGAQPIKERIDSYLVSQINGFTSAIMYPLLLESGDVTTAIEDACREQTLNALVLVLYDWSATGHHYLSHTTIGVFDCFGGLIYKGAGTSEKDIGGNYTDAYVTTTDAAADVALGQLRSQIQQDPTVAVNLMRYGIALGTGQRSAGFTLTSGHVGAVVSSVSPIGSAVIAGLQKFDVVVSLNGHNLADLQQADINTLVAEIERSGGSYSAEVVTADGKHVTLHFKSQDIRQYLNSTKSLR